MVGSALADEKTGDALSSVSQKVAMGRRQLLDSLPKLMSSCPWTWITNIDVPSATLVYFCNGLDLSKELRISYRPMKLGPILSTQ